MSVVTILCWGKREKEALFYRKYHLRCFLELKRARKQDLYLRQKPVELNRLIENAKIQSTESSNQIEGIVTTNARLLELVQDAKQCI